MLDRMGIKIDLQANLDRAIDLGSLLPTPARAAGRRAIISGSYQPRRHAATTSCTSRPATTARPCRCW
jgi:hypothetical protein